MSAALAADHVRFRDDVHGLLAAAFPGGEVSVHADRGPLRHSPGSIDPSEEWYGFELALRADTCGRDPADALDRITAVLSDRGWHSNGPFETTVEASLDGYDLWMQAEPGYVLIEADSALYRAPAEPGSSFVVEPRQQPG